MCNDSNRDKELSQVVAFGDTAIPSTAGPKNGNLQHSGAWDQSPERDIGRALTIPS